MEDNIADSLKMAGSVLLFVIGLSIAFLSFSQARESIDSILSFSDRETMTIENDERFYYLNNNNETTRYVGKETIIPTIYRAYKENFKVIFIFPDEDYYLFEKNGSKSKTIDLSPDSSMAVSIGSDLDSRIFLNGIIYKYFDDNENKFKQKFNISKINDISLYDYITEKEEGYKIKESLGTYYHDEVGGTPTDVNEANKDEKRVITYTFESR